jgi:hypothetical protein
MENSGSGAVSISTGDKALKKLVVLATLYSEANMTIKPCLRVPCPKCGAKAGDQCVLVGKFAGQSSAGVGG